MILTGAGIQQRLARYLIRTGTILNSACQEWPLLPASIFLARGFSAVSPEVLETMVEIYNRGLAPIVPKYGFRCKW